MSAKTCQGTDGNGSVSPEPCQRLHEIEWGCVESVRPDPRTRNRARVDRMPKRESTRSAQRTVLTARTNVEHPDGAPVQRQGCRSSPGDQRVGERNPRMAARVDRTLKGSSIARTLRAALQAAGQRSARTHGAVATRSSPCNIIRS